MKKTKLKHKLEEEGKKQKWLAKRCGINESIISLIINGRYNPDKHQMAKISAALEMDEDDLFKQ